MKTVAERIRWMITQRGISQRELARRSGLAEPTVNTALKRLEERPGHIELWTIEALAKGGEVSLCWLVTGEGEPALELPAGQADPTIADHPHWPRLVAHLKSTTRLADHLLERIGRLPSTVLPQPVTPTLVKDLARLFLEHSSLEDLPEPPVDDERLPARAG